VFIIYGDNGFLEYKYLKKERDKLAENNEAILQDNLELYRRVERLKKDLTYIESVARKELGVIGKDEIIIKLNQ
jgi:cell division protein FtsB